MNSFKNYRGGDYAQTARTVGLSEGLNHSNHGDQCSENCGTSYEFYQPDRRNKSLFGSSKYQSKLSSVDDNDFNRTSSKIYEMTFRHHDSDLCVCDHCTCGRHLCNFKCVKPEMSRGSIYNQSFVRKCAIPNNVNRATEYDKLQGPHIGLDTNYKIDYDEKKGDVNEKRKPENLLKGGGPGQNLTSYSSGFPGHRGLNQYVKPVDTFVRGDFPMLGKSTYTNSFIPKSTSQQKSQKNPDNLKTGNLWMGKTTYGGAFKNPNPEDYALKFKNTQKLVSDPNYGKQFQTTYKNSYIGIGPSVCPAKIALETRTKGKGCYCACKKKFEENGDFKSLNPTFHAISTSKHSCV